VGFSLLSMADGFAATPPALRADVPVTATPGASAPATSAPAAAKPAPAPPAAAPSAAAPAALAAPSADAAAKHAKRTACLKDAKTNKLVGAEKAAFLKNCIAAQ
jgi:hypothetical protein